MFVTQDYKVEVLEKVGEWYKIKYNGVTGYMSSDYVSVRKGVEVDRSGLTVDRYGTTGETIVNYAAQFLGTPYVYGGSSPSGFDCSGFVQSVFKKFGIKTAETIYQAKQKCNNLKIKEVIK